MSSSGAGIMSFMRKALLPVQDSLAMIGNEQSTANKPRKIRYMKSGDSLANVGNISCAPQQNSRRPETGGQENIPPSGCSGSAARRDAKTRTSAKNKETKKKYLQDAPCPPKNRRRSRKSELWVTDSLGSQHLGCTYPPQASPNRFYGSLVLNQPHKHSYQQNMVANYRQNTAAKNKASDTKPKVAKRTNNVKQKKSQRPIIPRTDEEVKASRREKKKSSRREKKKSSRREKKKAPKRTLRTKRQCEDGDDNIEPESNYHSLSNDLTEENIGFGPLEEEIHGQNESHIEKKPQDRKFGGLWFGGESNCSEQDELIQAKRKTETAGFKRTMFIGRTNDTDAIAKTRQANMVDRDTNSFTFPVFSRVPGANPFNLFAGYTKNLNHPFNSPIKCRPHFSSKRHFSPFVKVPVPSQPSSASHNSICLASPSPKPNPTKRRSQNKTPLKQNEQQPKAFGEDQSYSEQNNKIVVDITSPSSEVAAEAMRVNSPPCKQKEESICITKKILHENNQRHEDAILSNQKIATTDVKFQQTSSTSDQSNHMIGSQPTKYSSGRLPGHRTTPLKTSSTQRKDSANHDENIPPANMQCTSPLESSFSGLKISRSIQKRTPQRRNEEISRSSLGSQDPSSSVFSGTNNIKGQGNSILNDICSAVVSSPQNGEITMTDGLVKRLFQGKNCLASSLPRPNKAANGTEHSELSVDPNVGQHPITYDPEFVSENLSSKLNAKEPSDKVQTNPKHRGTPHSSPFANKVLNSTKYSEPTDDPNDSKFLPGDLVSNLESALTAGAPSPEELAVSSDQTSDKSAGSVHDHKDPQRDGAVCPPATGASAHEEPTISSCQTLGMSTGSLDDHKDSQQDGAVSAAGRQSPPPQPKTLLTKQTERSDAPRRSSRSQKPTERLQIKSWKYANYQKKVKPGGSKPIPDKCRNDDATKKVTNDKEVAGVQDETDDSATQQPVVIRKSERSRKTVDRFSVKWKKSGAAQPKNNVSDKNDLIAKSANTVKGPAEAREDKITGALMSKNQKEAHPHRNTMGKVDDNTCAIQESDETNTALSARSVSPTSTKLKRLVKNAVSKAHANANARTEDKLAPTPSGCEWTSGEIIKLRNAHAKAEPTSVVFWDDIALKVTGKTAFECKEKWFSLVKSPKGCRAPGKSNDMKKESIFGATAPSIEAHDEDDDDDDIFNSTPLRGILTEMKKVVRSTVQGKGQNKAKHNKSALSLPFDFGSPIAGFSAEHSEGSPNEPTQDFSEVSPVDFRLGYKGYINGIMRGCKKATSKGTSLGNSGQQRKQNSSRDIYASAGAGVIQMNGILAPDCTVRVEPPPESDLEDMLIFSDDELNEDEIETGPALFKAHMI